MEGKVIPPVEPVDPPMPAAKSNKWLIPILGLFSVLLVAVTAVLAYQNYLLRKASTSAPSSLSSKGTTPSPATNTTPSPTKTSGTISVDDTWNQYTNYQLGFSLKVPKVTSGDAPCVWSTKNGDHSYRPSGMALVPLKIFEDKNIVHIVHEYTYQLTGETKEGNRSFFAGCEKSPATLENLEKNRGWHIITKTVGSDQELAAFIKSEYGSSCQVGNKKLSGQEGVFDVEILGDGKGLDETQCPINFMYVLKYAPEKNKAFTWGIGQDDPFTIEKDGGPIRSYSEEMTKSFKAL